MSANSDDPESAIPWPGFVDILSTVIIVFVFFMMMTSVIIFVLSEEAKRAAVSEAEKRAESASDIDQDDTKTSPTQILSPDVNNLLQEKAALQKEVARLTQLKTVLSESTQQSTEQKENQLVLHYGDLGATITDATHDVIKATMPFAGKIQIISYIPIGNNFASIREISLNRALNIRNVLLENGVESKKIALKIIPEPDTDMSKPDNVYGKVTLTYMQ